MERHRSFFVDEYEEKKQKNVANKRFEVRQIYCQRKEQDA